MKTLEKNHIKKLRLKRKMSRMELALLTNRSEEAVKRWELHLTEPDRETKLSLCDIFDVQLSQLFYYPKLDENAKK